MVYLQRRNSEEMLARQAREEERDASETIYEKVARLEEENRLLKLKLVEMLEMHKR